MPHTYVHKPERVEAAHFKDQGKAHSIAGWCGGTVETRQGRGGLHKVVILPDRARCDPGGFIVKHPDGYVEVIPQDQFLARYDRATTVEDPPDRDWKRLRVDAVMDIRQTLTEWHRCKANSNYADVGEESPWFLTILEALQYGTRIVEVGNWYNFGLESRFFAVGDDPNATTRVLRRS